MHARPRELIRLLKLQPHPEGGHFVETFRSGILVSPADGRSRRAALTVIYFLLTEGAFSRWHRVLSDEAWHACEGSLELFTAPPEGGAVTRTIVGPLSDESAPLHVVPAGWWQAARPRNAYALVGCSVGPGFDYSDFTLLSSIPKAQRPVFFPGPIAAGLLD
jgi:uncharacterized protein